jgi:hypothetical protein
MENYRRIAVRDCQAFLWQMYKHYEGEAHASFEGQLSSLGLDEIPGASIHATPGLQSIDGPPSDFRVVPINPATIRMLKTKLSAPAVLGREGSVNHTHLAVGTQPVFEAFDNFHGECSVISRLFPLGLLEAMLGNGILRSFERLRD